MSMAVSLGNTLLNPYQAFATLADPDLSVQGNMGAAGMLNWDVRLVKPHLVDDNGVVIDPGKHRYIVGNPTIGDGGAHVPTVFGASMSGYQCFQNEQLFIPLIEGFDNTGLLLDLLGAYDDGKAVFAVFRLPDHARLVETMTDVVETFVVAMNRHDGTGAAKAFLTSVRPECGNMLTHLHKSGKKVVTIRHTRFATPYLMQEAEHVLGLTEDWNKGLQEEIVRLEKQQVSKQQFVGKVVPALLGERPEDKGRSQSIFDRKFGEIVAAWDSPVAAQGDTGWRAYNAVTEWEQHHRTSNALTMAEAVLNGRTPMEDKALKVLAAL